MTLFYQAILSFLIHPPKSRTLSIIYYILYSIIYKNLNLGGVLFFLLVNMYYTICHIYCQEVSLAHSLRSFFASSSRLAGNAALISSVSVSFSLSLITSMGSTQSLANKDKNLNLVGYITKKEPA